MKQRETKRRRIFRKVHMNIVIESTRADDTLMSLRESRADFSSRFWRVGTMAANCLANLFRLQEALQETREPMQPSRAIHREGFVSAPLEPTPIMAHAHINELAKPILGILLENVEKANGFLTIL